MRYWRWMYRQRWYLFLGTGAAVEIILETYGLLTDGFRPDYWLPYVYSSVLVGCLAIYHWRVRLLHFVVTELAPRASNDAASD